MSKPWPTARLSEVLRHRKEFITIDDVITCKRPCHMSDTISLCPRGTTENSPAFQRRVNVSEIEMSPAGTTEPRAITGAMAEGFFRPYGTRFPLPPIPTVETVGYFRASLRDWGSTNDALRSRKEACT
jgi:hypothetical protein